MPIDFRERTLADVPVLLAAVAGAERPRPAVLWFHGLGADAAVHRPELARVAAAGFLAVGVDARGHGRRRAPDLDARIAAPLEEARASMLELACATGGELPALVDALESERLAEPGGVAAVGISMGGYLAYQAAIVEPRIRTVVALLGSPEWPGGGGPHREPAALARAALLSITAELDVSVPPDAARRLHAALDARDGAAPRRYLELPGAHHLMSADAWAAAMDATVAWLVRHAPGGRPAR